MNHTMIVRSIKKLLVLPALLGCFLLKAQDEPQARLRNYAEKVLQEKLYMHTDRDFYLAGDLVWFKLYNVDASLHQPLGISKVAYVEILDATNTPAAQVKIGMEDGKGNGSVYLPVTLQSGNYKLRAYTNWMKNMGADYFFEKRITIVNTQKQRDNFASTKQDPPDIRFFPEGGNLVNSISSRIAFKATSTDGKGINCSGRIVDEQNATVAQFQSGTFGMGSFSFTPQSAHTYKAVIDIQGTPVTVALPQVFAEGYVMQLSDSVGEKISVQVSTNKQPGGELYLLAHTRQMTKAVLQATVQNGKALFSIDKNKLGDGITHFTVFTSSRQPVCERLYFKYPGNPLTISLQTKSASYGTRVKVPIEIQATDNKGIGADADMSMAVYQLDELQGVEQTDINTYLWLTSDLKGNIESPTYYFKDVTPAIIKDMDNLMLTQGWRRFQWNDVLQDKKPVFTYAPEYNGHIVTGKVVHGTTGNTLAGVEAYASAPGAATAFMPALSDATGKLMFEMPTIKGASEIIVQTAPATDSLARIEISSPFFENFTATKLPRFYLPKTQEAALLEHNLATQVQNVYTGEQLKRFGVYTDTSTFFQKPNATYFLDNYTRFSTMEEVMREYVAYMDVRKRQGSFRIPLLDLNRNDFFDADPLLLVDGVPVFDVEKLMAFDPLKMKKLEVVNYRYFIGNSSFKGIMNWHTYKNDLAGYELNPRAIVIDYESLQSNKEYYTPVYDTPEKTASRIPDFRNVLYWSPNVSASKGKGKVELYTSDRKGKYVAIVQGLTAAGQAGVGVMEFEVK